MNFLLQHFQSISPTFSFDIFFAVSFSIVRFYSHYRKNCSFYSFSSLIGFKLSISFFLLIKNDFFFSFTLSFYPSFHPFFYPRIHKKYYLYEKYRLCNIFNGLLFDRLFSFYINPNPNQINLVRYNSIGRPERLHMTSHMRLT